MTFKTTLTPEQYDELYRAMTEAVTIAQIKGRVEFLAKKWDCYGKAEEC